MAARLPTVVKLARGTAKKSRLNSREPVVTAVDRPAPPADLNPPEADAWDRLAAAVGHLRCVAESDLELLRAASIALARSERCNRDPASTYNQQLRCESHLLSMLKELGLSPVARSKVSVIPAPSPYADRLAEFRHYPGKS